MGAGDFSIVIPGGNAAGIRGERILFLDPGVAVRPGLLAAHQRALDSGAAACAGMVVFTGQPTLAWQVVSQSGLMPPFWGPVANLSVTRRAFEAAGGFDPAIREGGEFIDLGFRLIDAGYRVVTSRDAVVEQSIEAWSSWPGNIARLIACGRAHAQVIARHPRRSYTDPASGLAALGAQFATSVAGAALLRGRKRARVLGAVAASAAAYHLLFAAVKHGPGRSFVADMLGPTVLASVDLGRLIEGVRMGHPEYLFRHVRLLGQHQREGAANTVGFAVSSAVLAAGVVAALRNPPR